MFSPQKHVSVPEARNAGKRRWNERLYHFYHFFLQLLLLLLEYQAGAPADERGKGHQKGETPNDWGAVAAV